MLNRKTFSFLFVVCVLAFNIATAQTTKYITHVIQKGETLSALSVKYKTTVGDIMRLNSMTTSSKLAIGQKVKIPVKGSANTPSTSTASQATTKPSTTSQSAKPATKPSESSSSMITHTVAKGETLYGLSKKYKVSINQIKEWNNLTTENITIGQKLSIGGVAATSSEPTYAVESPSSGSRTTEPAGTSGILEDTQVGTVATSTSRSNNKPPTTPKNTDARHVTDHTVTSVNETAASSEGYFAPLFGKDVDGRTIETLSGSAMTFKTASGWTDKKYYILMNDVSPGAIVKISPAGSDKIIYAKVLWNMNDMKENEGLTFRISNAAAEALGVSGKFELTITYFD